ncbi:MAG: ferrochelatase [Steroidobacteraceae bacterium]
MNTRTGVLVANLGTPDAPTPDAVRRFLAEFLSDPRVVDLPRILWLPILYGVILRIRPQRSARAYREVWTAAGSPLLVNTLALAAAVEQRLTAKLAMPIAVATGMTYGTPSIATALQQLQEAGVERLIVLPLYPQYSATTTASVYDRVEAALLASGWQPELRKIDDYHDDVNYIAAVADSLAPRLHDERAHLLFSFHGLPQRYVDAGDPYEKQCRASAARVIERLALPASRWSLAFQSRVGRARWLEPYTEERLAELAAGGVRHLVVACPGFSVDCLETLEEIAMRGRDTFLAAGGERFEYVPALNDSAAHSDCLAALIVGRTTAATAR